MGKVILSLIFLNSALLLAGCAEDLRGPQNLMIDNNCSGDGFQIPGYCTSGVHPFAGPYGSAYRDSRWHQFDDQDWLNIR